MLVVDFDDFGVDHVISDQCRTRDCRAELNQLKELNPAFKVTLFSVPAYTTLGLLKWAKDNRDWVQLGVHGWDHHDNWECEKWDEIHAENMLLGMTNYGFKKLFKAPGWQISDDIYKVLKHSNWIVADQPYNDDRRPEGLRSYVIRDEAESVHGHTWNCCGNGIEETLDQLKERIKDETEFRFVTEVAG